MKEYKSIIDKYKNEYYSVYFTHCDEKWGDIEKAERYLEKYWLTKSEYEGYWEKIQKGIFTKMNDKFPNISFDNNYNIIILKGGGLFCREEFEIFQNCIKKVNDDHFVIIENKFTDYFDEDSPPFMMKYPTNITWEELLSGNFISTVLFFLPEKEYFVFGNSASWAKYTTNDYKYPLDILAFKSEYSNIFMNKFILSKEEKNDIKRWLPPEYKKYLID